jgi:hypothetical protein
MEEGDRVRVRPTGRTGRIARVSEAGDTKRYAVAYDELTGVPRPVDGSSAPELGQDWGEHDLEPI